MSKKQRKFRIGHMKSQKFDFQVALANIARQFMQVERKLTPLIKAENIPPNEAVVLIACYTDAVLTGHENQPTHKMSEDDIMTASNTLLMLWKKGLFVPSKEYPYTLEQTLAENADGEAEHG